VRYDVHQHLWPESFIDALRARAEVPFLRDDRLTTIEGTFTIPLDRHRLERRLELLDEDEVDVAIVSLQPGLGVESLDAHEREELELTWVEGVRPLVAGCGGRLLAHAPWRILEGFVGTSIGASALLDEGVGAEILHRVDDVGGLVFVHPDTLAPIPASRPEWWQWVAGYTGQMQQAYLAWIGDLRERYPSIRIIFAILAGGAPIQHERLVHRGAHVRGFLDPNTLFDTASYGRRALELCIETFGVDRLVYGSDVPVLDPTPTLRAVRGLGDAVAQLIQTDNTRRVLS
jgi:hypothetical protein